MRGFVISVMCLCLALVGCAGAGPPTPTSAPVATGTAPASSTPTPSDPYTEHRQTMVARQIEGRGITDNNVLDAMRAVPRHLFVPDRYTGQAYADRPLPIGYGQTISQPLVVAMMTEALEIEPGDSVLEIGTGSGYQAAVLAEAGADVYTIEIIPQLADRAENQLREAGYTDVHVHNADGYFGWEEHAPYDGIMVTAAPDHLPQPLANQLKVGGQLIIPIGPPGSYQTLWLFTKQENGELDAESLGPVQFVPFVREAP